MNTEAIQEYQKMQKEFKEKYEKNIDFRLKVIVWHILLSKILLHQSLDNYLSNFFRDWEFDSEKFMNFVWNVDLKLDWDNYKVRYSSFEQIENLQNLLWENKLILSSLKDSIVLDFSWLIWIVSYSTDFERNKWKVIEWIERFLDNQYGELKKVVWEIQSKETVSDFESQILKIL